MIDLRALPVIRCDHEDCIEEWIGGTGDTVGSASVQAQRAGWTGHRHSCCDELRNYCPDHDADRRTELEKVTERMAAHHRDLVFADELPNPGQYD